MVCWNAICMSEDYAMKTGRQYHLARQDVVHQFLYVASLHWYYVILVPIYSANPLFVHIVGDYANLVQLVDFLLRVVQFANEKPRIAKHYLPGRFFMVTHKLLRDASTNSNIWAIGRKLVCIGSFLYSTPNNSSASRQMIVCQYGTTHTNIQIVGCQLGHFQGTRIQILQ